MQDGLVVAILAISLGLPSGAARQPMASTPEPPSNWTTNEAMLLFFQIAGLMQSHALDPVTVQESVLESIHHLTDTIDPFAEYLTPEETREWSNIQRSNYAGVGMDIRRNRDGSVVCIPYPESPAQRAGLTEGDRLIAVNGERIADWSPRRIAINIRGESHTEVILTIQRPGQPPQSFPVQRTPMRSRTVTQHLIAGIPTLRIFAFEPSTPSEILAILSGTLIGSDLIIDISGNQGGDLYAAIDAARLFLDKDTELLTVQNQKSKRTWTTEKPGVLRETQVFVLVDENTASAAEVFAAALLANKRGTLYGSPTFGKGLTQHVFNLLNGGTLILTDGRLYGPGGLEWHQTGLPVIGSVPDLLQLITR